MSSAESSRPSSGSSTRTHSLGKPHQPPEDIIDPAAGTKGKAKGNSNHRSTPQTIWTLDETNEFTRLLILHYSSTGDGGFKEETFNQIADGINIKFPAQKVKKTGSPAAQSGALSEYTLVKNIRAASGLNYDERQGVVVDEATRQAWDSFCKSHPGAAKYENSPWPYFEDLSAIMSSVSKHVHVTKGGGHRHTRGQKNYSTTIPGPTAGSSRESHQPLAAMEVDAPDAISSTMETVQTWSDALQRDSHIDPNAMTPETPSTYLSQPPYSTLSTASTPLTSVSQKRKVSSVPGSQAGSDSQRKRSRPSSMVSQARVGSDIVLERLSNFVNNIDPAIFRHIALASLGVRGTQMLRHSEGSSDDQYIEKAAEVLMSLSLPPSETNDLADYMSDPQNKNRVKFFLAFNGDARSMWIKNTPEHIQVKKQRKMEQIR